MFAAGYSAAFTGIFNAGFLALSLLLMCAGPPEVLYGLAKFPFYVQHGELRIESLFVQTDD